MIKKFKIPLSDLETILDQHLHNNAQLFLSTPNELIDYIIQAGMKNTLTPITGWDAFEAGENIPAGALSDLLFFNMNETDDMFLVTDEGLYENTCFHIAGRAEFTHFTQVYEQHYAAPLYHPADYIAYFPFQLTINIIYHEGVLCSAVLK